MTQPPHDKDPVLRALADPADDIPPEIMDRARRQLDGLRSRMEARQNQQRAGTTSFMAFWRWMVPALAAVAVIVLATMVTTQVSSQKVYAQTVRRIREARTLQAAMVTRFDNSPEMNMQVSFRNDGLVRIDMPGNLTSIVDSRQMKTYTFERKHKIMIESELNNLPEAQQKGRDPAREIERLRHLPEKATEQLGEQTLQGRVVRGYKIVEKDEIDEVWIDAATRELVRIEARSTAFPGVVTLMSDFKFDAPLAPDFFATETPAGYQRQVLNLNLANPGAEDLAIFLKFLVRFTPDGTFPPTLNPVDIQKLVMKAQQNPSATNKPTTGSIDLNAIRKETAEAAARSARAMLLIVSMKPENDWHYVGAGVKPGDAKTPIAWWKPAGAANYKVIYADLSVRDEPPGAIPTPKAP